MKRTEKRLLTMVMILAVIALLPAMAMAATANSAATLKEALAGTDATITLTGSFELGEKITINRDVTIKGSYTITRAESYTGTLFAVANNKSLTLDGGLTIDGNNNYAFDRTTYEADVASAKVIAAADCKKWFTPETGKPVASAYMITAGTGCTLNLKSVTICNNYSTNSGVTTAGQNSTINLEGAKITHCASTNGNGVVANVSASGINVNVKAGTVIDGNHVGGNHGLFKIYSGATLNMTGGEIKNTTGWNSNGTVVGTYGGTFKMSGGTICSNSSVSGPNNGRCAPVYIHSSSRFEMTDGTICHNTAIGTCGGVDASHTNGGSSTAVISGGNIVDNKVISPWNGYGPYSNVYGGPGMQITGGTYSQDVTEFIPEGRHLYAFDNGDGTWTVKEGTEITYKLNGGKAEGNPSVHPLNEPLTLHDPVRKGFTFLGWTGANGTRPQKNLTITLTAYEAEFVANWKMAGGGAGSDSIGDLPKTGDSSSLMLFVMLMAASVAGLAVINRRRDMNR